MQTHIQIKRNKGKRKWQKKVQHNLQVELITALKEGNKEIAGSIKESAGDTFKPFVDQITAPLNNIKAGIETLPGGKTFMKLGAVITKPFKSNASAEKEDCC